MVFMDVVSDTDENFDHHAGLSSPNSSEVDEDGGSRMMTEEGGTGGVKVTEAGLTQEVPDSCPECPASPTVTKVVNEEMSPEVSQLQEMLGEMRSGFESAMHTLSEIQYGDQALEQKVENNKVQYEKQLADVLQMVVNLKSEFSKVSGQLHQATSGHRELQSQVVTLQSERDILLEELEKAGAISTEVREKYHSGQQRPSDLRQSASLSALLDQTRHYGNHQQTRNGSQNSVHVTSDHDSGVNSMVPGDSCDDSPTTFSPIMHSYIAGLKPPVEVSEGDEHYESDSSITAAANRSLDLSRSLGDELDLNPSEDEDNSSQIQKNIISPDNILESSFKRPETPKKVAPHERNANEIQRANIAKELLSTEKKYCSSLWILLDTFAASLKNSGMMSLTEISQMFPPSLANIYDHHCELLQALEQRLSSCKWQCVLGDILARFIQDSQCNLLKQYQNYMKDFPGALQHIRKNMHINAAFRRFIKDVQRMPCCENLDVGAFLITPVQRMPRYVLLLKQLLKVTEVDHPDHYYLETSLHHLASFLNQLNSSIEHSIQLVSSQEPKPKRRFRIPSFRQSNVSSIEGIQEVPPTRVAGFLAHRSHKSASAIGSAGPVKPSAETIYGSLHGSPAVQSLPFSNHGDDTFTAMDDTLPLQVEPPVNRPSGVVVRQRKNQSSHSKVRNRGRKEKHGSTQAGTLTQSSSFTSSQSGSQYSGGDHVVCGGGVGSRVSGGRPLSMGEEAFASYYNTKKNNTTTSSNSSSMDFYHPMHPPPAHYAPQLQNGPPSIVGYAQHSNSTTTTQHPPLPQFTSTSTPYNAKAQLHHYGVFGDVDSDTDADISSSTNTASLQSPRVVHLQQPQRRYLSQQQHHHLRELRSQSCMDVTRPIIGPSQDHINAALARSLTFKASCQTLPSHRELSENGGMYEASWLGDESEASSVTTSHRTALETSNHRSSLNESDLISPANSTLQVQGLTRKEAKKKRAKLTSASETDLLDGSLLRKKKPTLKQSIKNIFFRKSRPETDSQDNQSAMVTTTHGVISEESTKVIELRQNGNCVPGKMVTRQHEEQIDSVIMLEEEEPCSAV